MDAAGYESFIHDEKDHFWFVGRRAVIRDFLRHSLPPLGPEARVADLGCCVGGMLEIVAEHGDLVGMDANPGVLRRCRERGYPGVFAGRGDRLPLASDSLDLITLFDVLEHVREERETLDECRRALKPGGWLMLSGPAYQILYTHQDKVVDHQRRYTLPQLRRSFTAAGFQVVRASYFNSILFPAILPTLLFRKAWERVFVPGPDESRLNTEIPIPGWANRLCARIFASERHLLRHLSFPFGHSLLLLARKPVHGG